LRFKLLGEIAAETDDGLVSLGEVKHRHVLAVLVERRGDRVGIEHLIDRVWGDDPPESAKKLVRDYLSDLRKILEAAEPGAKSLLPSGAGGAYRLEVPPEDVDVHRFTRLCARALRAEGGAVTTVVEHCRTALAAWTSGTALAGLSGEWADGYRRRLEEELRAVWIRCLDAELALGGHRRILGELVEAQNRFPLDEKIAELRMLALYRARRPSEAEAFFEEFAKRLEKEIGADPGNDLMQIRRWILAKDPRLVVDEERPSGPKHEDRSDRMTTLADSALELVSRADGGTSPAANLAALFRREFGGDDAAILALDKITAGTGEGVRELRALLILRLDNDTSFREQVEKLIAAAPASAGPFVTARSIGTAAVFTDKVTVKRDLRIGG